MFERAEKILQIACAVLAALVVLQITRLAWRSNPLARARFPALPTLAAAETPTGTKGTNSAAALDVSKRGTNSTATAGAAKDTNTVQKASHTGTNAPSGTNVLAGTNSPVTTNASEATQIAQKGTNTPATQGPPKAGTNLVAESAGMPGSNAAVRIVSNQAGTNASSSSGSAAKGPGPMTAGDPRKGGTNFPGQPGAPPKAPDPPPEILARVDRVVDSEILGPVMHPMPMALLGIAGKMAFLRAANGQTGAVKEGDELGGLKLIRIGTNRVLVEEKGEKKELTIFSGFGSESLLAK